MTVLLATLATVGVAYTVLWFMAFFMAIDLNDTLGEAAGEATRVAAGILAVLGGAVLVVALIVWALTAIWQGVEL